MARRSQCSLAGDNPLDPNYLPPHYREEYRLAIDSLVEEDLEGYYQFLQKADVVDFLSTPEIQHIQSSVRLPQLSTHHPEQPFGEAGTDTSSDTYWPLHSDLDAPGLDLGWPQLHHFIGPTEVTTLVNPPEPDMPSIKDQARRLIKNAQQVIAIAMDMFTDVDMFSDILNATMRNVAVYIILDELNAHHFVDMVSNCRVDLQSIQCLRVRTVQGITYQCRSGKSFKGQMMDRFLFTDCRAVLSGNYSFMWSYEKLHRCMAHLFLGQLVTTFDEEFRILYAQSQPLIIDNTRGSMEDLGHPQKRPYPTERTSRYREPKKFLDTGNPDEWVRPSYDEGDWRMIPSKRQDQMRGPANIYGRFPSQQLRMDPSFDQGPPRTDMMENPGFKRHSYAEGVPGRYCSQFLQPQVMPDPESQGRHFSRGQQPYTGPERESDISGYDKFWNQDYLSTDQYSEPGLPQGIDSPDGFDPVLNYLSSSRPVDFDQGSEKRPAPELPFGSPNPRRQSLGHPYTCQTSPTPSNTTEQKLHFQEPNPDRKDPAVKRGLRNWRISSYLSAYENPEDEGLPMTMSQASDPFEEPPHPIEQATPAVDLSLPKIPNVREFKVPAIPRASQMPSYAKTMVREHPKKVPDEPVAVVADTKTTPTPSDSSSTTEGERIEEAEQKELQRPSVLRREDSFRRKYNAAQPRSSRLRSSLIFTSLDQQNISEDNKSDQQDEGSDKGEGEQTKLPFLSHLLGQKRSSAREPIEWSQFIKPATSTEASKSSGADSQADDQDNKDGLKKDGSENPEAQELSKQHSEAEQPSKSSVAPPLFIDMSDPDARLMFFKEMAAKRKAAKAAEEEKSKEKPAAKPPADPKNDTALKKEEPAPTESTEKTALTSKGLVEKGGSAETAKKMSKLKKEESVPERSSEDMATASEASSEKLGPAESAGKTAEEAPKSVLPSLDDSKQATDTDSCVSDTSKSSNAEQTKTSAGSRPTELDSSARPDKDESQCTDKNERPRVDSASKEGESVTPSSVKETPSSVMDSNTPKSVSTQSDICSLQSEQDTVSGASSPCAIVQNSSSDHTTSTLSSPKETASSNKTTKDSHLTPSYTIFLSDISSAKTKESISTSPQGGPQSAEGTIQKSENLSTQTQDLGFKSSKTTTGKKSEEVSGTTASSKESQKDISDAEKSVSESEKTITEADKDVSEPDKTDPDSSKEISEPENCVSELGKDISESEKTVSGSEKGVSFSVKEILGSNTDDSPSGDIVHETESVSGSDEVVSDLGKEVSKSEIQSTQNSVGKNSEVSGSSEDIKANPMSPDCSPFVCDQDLHIVESSDSELDSSVKTDISSSETISSSDDASKQTTAPSDLNMTSDTPIFTETVSSSPLPSESDLSPEAKTAETNMSAVQSSSDTKSLGNETSNKPSKHAETKSPSSPTEPSSKVPTEVNPPCKTPESVTSKSHTSDSSVPADDSKTKPELLDTDEQKSGDTKNTSEVDVESKQESGCSEKTNEQAKQNNNPEPADITAKQPKPNQSRYHTSTANVLSSSNLRDDTKLLLEQISANSQTRSETTKESPVTDDEKEDVADKNAKRELERGIRTLSREQPKSGPEREKLLERIQCMRKERKVYSRFEV